MANIELKPIIPFSSNTGYTSISSDDSTTVHIEHNDNINELDNNNKIRRKYAILGIIISAVLFVLTVTNNNANTRNLGSSFDRTITFRQVTHPDTPTSLWGTVTKPYPTGAFWTNFVVKQGDGVVGVIPYGIKVLETGVQISYGATRRVVTQAFISDPFFVDLQISATEKYLSRAVESYDNSSVTMTYRTNNAGRYRVHLVKGSPFITVVYDGTTPIISSELMQILEVEQKVIKNGDGVQFIVMLGNFQRWLIYCSEPIALQWRENSLVATGPIKGYIRAAILPAQNYVEAYKALLPYVKRYPVSATWTFAFTAGNTAEVNIQFNTGGSGPLLMFALPHHLQIMQTPNIKSDEIIKLQKLYSPIYSIKGKLKVIIGDQWKLVYSLVPVSWNYLLADKLSTSQMDEIAKSLLIDVQAPLPTVTDQYAFGKQIGRIARLALIADEFGISNARQQAIVTMETLLSPWLSGSNVNYLVYDKTWGGIVPQHGLESNINDFGAGWYSDHHFHYGYFINAFATLAKLDPPYWAINRPAMESIIRDICNPDGADPDFPFFRHKDMYDGHSWASGLFQQGNGKGQESSSESVNAYYGAYLYGLATGNADLTRIAHLMLTMEVHSTKVYWHMTDSDVPDLYDSIFAANRMLGNIGAIDITSSTWFGSKFEFVHGINMMPLTPATAVLFDQQYVMQQWPVLGSRISAIKNIVPDQYRKCSASKDCVNLGLQGNCCPNNENVFLQCCNITSDTLTVGSTVLTGVDIVQDEWKAFIYVDHAVVDRDAAWEEIKQTAGFGPGNSKTNCLYWAASRALPPSNYTAVVQKPDFKTFIQSSCNVNSACDAVGMAGNCCPMTNGISLGCCPRVVPT